MPRFFQPPPLALFSLKPLNEGAKKVVDDRSNQHLCSQLYDGSLVLSIGHVASESGDYMVLATLGRNGDVLVTDPRISRVQCSFEIDETTKIVMFHDRSYNQTSQVFGENVIPFRPEIARKVLVQNYVNTKIGFGGVTRDLVMFELVWHGDLFVTQQKIMERERQGVQVNPEFRLFKDGHHTAPSTGIITRPCTADPPRPELRFSKINRLGRGAFGEVYRGFDKHTKQFVAVKQVHRPSDTSSREWQLLKREIEVHRHVKHPHIVNYIDACEGPENTVEIYMGLKHGDLAGLVMQHRPEFLHAQRVVDRVLHQMLQAIDYLDTLKLVHRDIKPQNILYESHGSDLQFYLGDFGLSNRQSLAVTFGVGTPLYMAPEMMKPGEKQTHKADVWSLFVTIMWTMNAQGFREAYESWNSAQQSQAWVLSKASSLPQIEEMARETPLERASAAQMLVKIYNGDGLVTPLDQVPPLQQPKRAENQRQRQHAAMQRLLFPNA